MLIIYLQEVLVKERKMDSTIGGKLLGFYLSQGDLAKAMSLKQYCEENGDDFDSRHSGENGNHRHHKGSQRGHHTPKLVSARDDYNTYSPKEGYVGAYRTRYTFYK